jgi:hypothetical protein
MNSGKPIQLFTMCGAQDGTRTENHPDSSQKRHFLSQRTQWLTAKSRLKMHEILYYLQEYKSANSILLLVNLLTFFCWVSGLEGV